MANPINPSERPDARPMTREDIDNVTTEVEQDPILGSSTPDDPDEVSDLPQEVTQSYGTGLQGQPTDRAGRRAHFGQSNAFNEADAVLTGGDMDANYEQANAVGDEAVGGTAPTPDQDVVEDLAVAVGIETDDRSFLRTNDMLNDRDDRRWELDPQSSEDYPDRRG